MDAICAPWAGVRSPLWRRPCLHTFPARRSTASTSARGSFTSMPWRTWPVLPSLRSSSPGGAGVPSAATPTSWGTSRCGASRPGSSAAGSHLRHHHADGHPGRPATGVFAVWDGGLGIWAGIALATVVGLWRLRLGRRQPGPVHGRGGARPAGGARASAGSETHFNKELFGRPTTLPWGLEHPLPVPGGLRDSRQDPDPQHVPADLPVRVDLPLRLGRRAGLARPPPQDQGRRGCSRCTCSATSAYRSSSVSLRIDSAVYFLGLRLSPTSPRRSPHRPVLVLAQPAPPRPGGGRRSPPRRRGGQPGSGSGCRRRGRSRRATPDPEIPKPEFQLRTIRLRTIRSNYPDPEIRTRSGVVGPGRVRAGPARLGRPHPADAPSAIVALRAIRGQDIIQARAAWPDQPPPARA